MQESPPVIISTIPIDIPCAGCRYNLRTLQPSANCPECGKPVRESLDPTRLIFADPARLSQIATGTLFAPLAPASLICMMVLMEGIYPYLDFIPGQFREPFLVLASFGPALAFVVAAAFLCTKSESALTDRFTKHRLNRFTRCLAILLVIFVFGAMILEQIPIWYWSYYGPPAHHTITIVHQDSEIFSTTAGHRHHW